MSFRLFADLGNTTLHLGLWREGWALERRVAVAKLADERHWRNALTSAAAGAQLTDRACVGALISAGDHHREQLSRAVHDAFGISPRILGWDITLDMPVAYDDPTTIGQDRLLGAYAAQEFVGRPCIVLDAGTCLTCDAVSSEGTLLPIAIGPGIPVLAAGLHEATPHLAQALVRSLAGDITNATPPSRSTEECIAVGLLSALLGTAQRLLDAAFAALGPDETAPTIITGGDGDFLAPYLTPPPRYMPMLALDGLRLLDDSRAG